MNINSKENAAQKSFLRAVIGIAIPVGLQSMLQSSFAMIDQLMVGRLGSTAVTAVEVAGRPAFIYSVVLGAVSAIAGIMISKYLGMKDEVMADRSLSVNLTAAMLLAALFTVLCLLMPSQIVDLYIKDDPAVLHTGTSYLTLIVWTYLPMGISSILAVMIRCMDRAVWPLYAGIIAAVVNTALNYVLIFGHFGFPALGVTGAAIASVISQIVNLLLTLIMFFRIRVNGRGSLHFSLALGKEGYKQFLTMSMTGPIQGLFIGTLSGVSQAAGILIGKRLGAREYDRAYRESKKLMWYGLIGSLILSTLLISLRGSYVLLYNVEPEVQTVSASLLLAFAVLAPVKVANMILGGGIIRSGGKTTYIMIIDMIGTWLVGAPLGLLTAFVFHLPVVWVYFILSQEELVRLFISFLVFRRKKWIASLSDGS